MSENEGKTGKMNSTKKVMCKFCTLLDNHKHSLFSHFKKKKHIFRGMNTITKNQHLEVKDPKHSCELLDAIEDAKQLEADPKAKRYTDMDKMWADLDK